MNLSTFTIVATVALFGAGLAVNQGWFKPVQPVTKRVTGKAGNGGNIDRHKSK